ncbi:hypothetical protein B0H13DRAFT_2416271 [Mycena leptocephala]|nr:hypothetical protein B0H13DRAFT_2416271 [Mycena leptocephala]
MAFFFISVTDILFKLAENTEAAREVKLDARESGLKPGKVVLVNYRRNRDVHCSDATISWGNVELMRSPAECGEYMTVIRPDLDITVLSADPNSQKDDDNENTKLCSPTRWVPAEDSDGDAHRNDSAQQQETETDWAQRDELLALIKQTNGISVDTSRLQLKCVKDVHPFRDPLKTLLCANTCPIILCAIESFRVTPTARFHKPCILVNLVFHIHNSPAAKKYIGIWVELDAQVDRFRNEILGAVEERTTTAPTPLLRKDLVRVSAQVRKGLSIDPPGLPYKCLFTHREEYSRRLKAFGQMRLAARRPLPASASPR